MSASPSSQTGVTPNVTLPIGVIRWGNLPVPYVAAWSSEDTPRVARDPLVQFRPAIVRNGRRGYGTPIFGKMDERRARRIVLQRRCQVCAQPLRGEGFVLDVPYARAALGLLVNEPATCRFCFAVSLALCPGIDRMLARPSVLVARVRDYHAVAVTIDVAEDGTPDINAALSAWKGPRPVVGYVRLAVGEHTIVTADEIRSLRKSALSSSQEIGAGAVDSAGAQS